MGEIAEKEAKKTCECRNLMLVIAFVKSLPRESLAYDQKEKMVAIEYKKSKIVRPYECIIIMDPSASEEQQKALFQKNKEIISSFDGEVKVVNTWGKRTLANNIDKLQIGNYFHTYFTASPAAIVELERTMGINEMVLRAIHAKLDETQTIEAHVEGFNKILVGSKERQQEAEARIQKKRAARMDRNKR